MVGLKLLIFLVCGALAKDHVPVLIWNTKQAQGGLPAVPVLQYMNYNTFQAKYLDLFKPKNIILFLQDALSVEDLSSHPSELHHVKQWMEKSHSLYLPNVENAAYLVHDLPSHDYNVVVLEPGVPAAGLDLKQKDNNLVVVKLPSTLTNPSRHRALQKADEVMENVISKIGAQRDFTFIFTGLKPSVEQHSELYEERIRVARSLLANDTDKIIGYHNTSMVKIYLHSNIVLNYFHLNSTDNNTQFIIDESNASANFEDNSDDKVKITMRYTDKSSGRQIANKVSVDFTFRRKSSEWMLVSASTLIDSERTYFKTVNSDVSGIPIGMSYSCSQKIYFISNETQGNARIQMVLDGVQVEAFSDKERFGDAWDCVGFFTVPIWVGLLTSLLFVFILTLGMYMLSNIKTMDRFDDPKGQPIMIPNTD